MPTTIRRYFRGHDLVTLQEPQTGQSRVYHFDHQGTTQALTDYSGAVTDTFAADAWGNQVKRTGTSINRQWYIGRWGYYKETGARLDYVRRRFRSGWIGQWITPDPALRLGAVPRWSPSRPSRTRYSYVSNRPTTLIDPSGLRGFQPCIRTPPIWELANAPKICAPMCGPEVGRRVREALYDVSQKWMTWDDNRKGNNCLSLTNFLAVPDVRRGFWDAWDIEQLFAGQTEQLLLKYFYRYGCAVHPDCQCSVSVYGKCHYPWAVNYVILGWMWQICRTSMPLWVYFPMSGEDARRQREIDYSRNQLESIIGFWQNLLSRLDPKDYHPSHVAAKVDWAVAGYDYWVEAPRERTPKETRPNCKTCHEETSQFTWRWNRWDVEE
jgi:RHS repeat-associated protein